MSSFLAPLRGSGPPAAFGPSAGAVTTLEKTALTAHRTGRATGCGAIGAPVDMFGTGDRYGGESAIAKPPGPARGLRCHACCNWPRP